MEVLSVEYLLMLRKAPSVEVKLMHFRIISGLSSNRLLRSSKIINPYRLCLNFMPW